MATPTLTTITSKGGQSGSAYVAIPDSASSDALVPGMLLFHAFRGLTPEFIDFAETYAQRGYIAATVDLYNGETTEDLGVASQLMGAMDEATCTDLVVSWADSLRTHDLCTGKIGTVGWCLGGTWSLNTSVVTPIDATVVYYGDVAKTADELAPLNGPVLGHFGTTDEYFGKDMVDAFEREMAKAEKPFTNHWYEAGHAFANTGGPYFHEESATLADDRTWDFLKHHLS
ncbi:MAG: dienelactone hydrolase family protein [Rhodospirillaceae bacterium]|nr:dienelactone hydrolase family protein [Rhodospirillaceae bacterium]MBT5240195.1 dienelactone hydrolase family protein [Rhodospirillaceae bacterium]MBT5566974.1 dienelactone hydrolase family protein [Rhodospirillaceae bacterium]MBT6090339.1 dienelactone hydrolase family protein [Rhodospirillaceae bacterium]MBT6959603.1 dienelactone hydrolase family protein [Rhodospirillaceae bacterium]